MKISRHFSSADVCFTDKTVKAIKYNLLLVTRMTPSQHIPDLNPKGMQYFKVQYSPIYKTPYFCLGILTVQNDLRFSRTGKTRNKRL